MQASPDWTAIVGVATGVYAAVLSTILAIREITKNSRHVRIVVVPTLTPPSSAVGAFAGEIGDKLHDGLQISVTNTSFRPITIQTIGVRTKDRRFIQDARTQAKLPARLDDGENITVIMQYAFIRKSEVEIEAVEVADVERRVFRKKLSKQLRELAKSRPLPPSS